MYLIFAILWVATFLPAWYVLLKLVALSTTNKLFSVRFFAWFILYQLIMALPYLYVLVYGGDGASSIVRSVAYSIVLLGVALSIIRFFFSRHVNAILWYVYGHVYDGLLHFYPYASLQELVFKNAKPSSEMNILDLGAGSGNQTMKLAHSGAQIVAVDNSKSMLAKLQKKLKNKKVKSVRVLQSDQLEYVTQAPGDEFDLIVMVNVLYTVTDRELLWKELLRILKDDGRIVITNSDRGGNGSLIREHIKNKSWMSLLRPSLVAVFVVDTLISEMAKTGHFSFIDEATIRKEVESAGGKYRFIERCYGDVNLLFEVTKK